GAGAAAWQLAGDARRYPAGLPPRAAPHHQAGRFADQPDVPAYPAYLRVTRSDSRVFRMCLFLSAPGCTRFGGGGADSLAPVGTSSRWTGSAALLRMWLALVGVAGGQDPVCEFAGDVLEAARERVDHQADVGPGRWPRGTEGPRVHDALVDGMDQLGVQLDGGRRHCVAGVVGFETAQVDHQLVVGRDPGALAGDRGQLARVLEGAQQRVLKHVGGGLGP